MRLIDSHVHLWDLSRVRIPWLSGPDLEMLQRSFSLSDYREAASGANVDRIVYLEVDIAVDQQSLEAEYAAGLCQDPTTRVGAAVIGGHPGSKGFREHIETFATREGIRGVRQVLQVPSALPGHCLTESFVDDVRWLGTQGLSFDLCMRAEELTDGAELIRQCPGTEFILDHCGNPKVAAGITSEWRSAIKELAGLPNVRCKLSGLVESARPDWNAEDLKPFVEEVIDSFGPSRVIFASNWPVCNLNGSFAAWMDAVIKILSRCEGAEREQIFYQTAQRAYRLELDR